MNSERRRKLHATYRIRVQPELHCEMNSSVCYQNEFFPREVDVIAITDKVRESSSGRMGDCYGPVPQTLR